MKMVKKRTIIDIVRWVFASKNSNITIRFIVSRVQLSNSCKSSYTNAKQCKMYGNLFVAKERRKLYKHRKFVWK